MSLDSFFLFLAKPVVYNIPKAMVFLLLVFLAFGKMSSFLESKFEKKKLFRTMELVFIIVLGLYFRLTLAYFFKGDFDLRYWNDAANVALRRDNIYVFSPDYHYFPPWLMVLIALKKIQFIIPSLPFYFLVKVFLSLVDVFSLYLLYHLAKLKKLTFNRVAAAYFLNPVIITITGVHGQFDSLAALFVLLGIYLYLRNKKLVFSWLSFTFAGIVKHIYFNQVLIFLNDFFKGSLLRIFNNRLLRKRKFKVFLYFFFSCLLAFSTLLPFWQRGKEAIIQELFLYSYTKITYGIPFVLSRLGFVSLIEPYKYLFMAMFFAAPFLIKGKNYFRLSLLGTLFYVSFTPGIGDQHFILPLAIGSLMKSSWFYLYSFLASLYLLGSSAQFNVSFFKIFSDNFIWLTAVFWFFSELKRTRRVNNRGGK